MANKTLISSHGHQTNLLEGIHTKYCEFCILPKPAVYHCIECDANICGDCFEIPREISHRLHQDHSLSLKTTSKPLLSPFSGFPVYGGLDFFICKGCKYISLPRGRYECDDVCDFRMCVECGVSKTSKGPLRWEGNDDFRHWSDVHQLVRCRFREYVLVVEQFPYHCTVCDLPMYGVGYACVRLSCKHFIHESCVDIPPVVYHPLHPHHPLIHPDFSLTFDYKECGVCRLWDTSQDQKKFNCDRCSFAMHFQCAISALRTIKLDAHEHALVNVPDTDTDSFNFTCHVCKQLYRHRLRCVQCKRSFHTECVSLPSKFEHDHHDHALILMKGLPDASHPYLQNEYSCNICEAMIKEARQIHLYGCNGCRFYAHIECVLSKKDGSVQFSSPSSQKNHSSDKEIKRAIHDHPLSLQNGTNKLCRMCKLQIDGQAYACEELCDDDDDEFWVHEECAALPQTLQRHPLHPNHELDLAKRLLMRSVFDMFSSWGGRFGDREWFICGVCGDVSQGFHFSCRSCDFFIDIKCVLDADKFRQTFYDKHARKTLKQHLLHPQHDLTLVNLDARLHKECSVCLEELSGPSYYCTKCIFFYGFHETCMEWPRLIQGHPIAHHDLQLHSIDNWQRLLDKSNLKICFACGNCTAFYHYEVIDSIREIHYHLECGSSLARPFDRRRGGRGHRFYYLHRKPKSGRGTSRVLRCTYCIEEVRNSYYRCLECDLHIHFGCLHDAAWLPRAAEHKHHQHRLALKEYVEYGGYYCDICEEPRDPRHPSYGCDECEFVVHVECIISEENASTVVLQEIESDGAVIPQCSPDS